MAGLDNRVDVIFRSIARVVVKSRRTNKRASFPAAEKLATSVHPQTNKPNSKARASYLFDFCCVDGCDALVFDFDKCMEHGIGVVSTPHKNRYAPPHANESLTAARDAIELITDRVIALTAIALHQSLARSSLFSTGMSDSGMDSLLRKDLTLEDALESANRKDDVEILTLMDRQASRSMNDVEMPGDDILRKIGIPNADTKSSISPLQSGSQMLEKAPNTTAGSTSPRSDDPALRVSPRFCALYQAPLGDLTDTTVTRSSNLIMTDSNGSNESNIIANDQNMDPNELSQLCTFSEYDLELPSTIESFRPDISTSTRSLFTPRLAAANASQTRWLRLSLGRRARTDKPTPKGYSRGMPLPGDWLGAVIPQRANRPRWFTGTLKTEVSLIGGIKLFIRRYCVLSGRTLSIYRKSKSTAKPERVIIMSSSLMGIENRFSVKEKRILIVAEDGTHIRLKATSRQLWESWMKELYVAASSRT